MTDSQKRAPVPTGIQRVLFMAVADRGFRELLFDKRDEVARAAGIELTPAERSVLRAATEAQLETLLEHLPDPPSPRRDFFLETAAAAVALLGAPVALASQGCTHTAGASPDVPPSNPSGTPPEDPNAEPPPQRPESLPNAGVAPDVPPAEPAPATRGISPDVPPKRARSR